MNLEEAGCEKIISEDETSDILEAEPLRDQKGDDAAIQIKPQRVRLKIRPGHSYQVPLQFRFAKNYPMDLYFLFDGSYTMNQVKHSFTRLISDLVIKIESITTNYTFGFGSFQDKVILPFTSTAPDKLIEPFPGAGKPFDFHHQMSLQQDGNLLKNTVKNANWSANLDIPEGGLDAVMQVLSCQERIGWRQTARRMILIATDQFCHYAGDGRLAGIVEPNDENCHLDSTGFYKDHTKYDYPSIAQIAKKLREKDTYLIFAVNQTVISKYQELSNLLVLANASKLETNNIVTMVKENYEAISSKVVLQNISTSSDIHVSFKSSGSDKINCTENTCEGISIGDQVTFTVEVQVAACPSPGESTERNVIIKPAGLPDSLVIEMDLICQCENCNDKVPNSDKCSENGTLECGVCKCNVGYSGKECECDKEETSSVSDDIFCKPDNNTIDVCSGHGTCFCGQCKCGYRDKDKNEKYSGTFCQCDDYSCPIAFGELCGGVERGRCECGVCHCTPKFKGDDCSCALRTDTCISTIGKICNDHGKCECGKCICNPPYRPPLCEKCPTCPGACSSNENCVKCILLKEGEYSEEECQEKCSNVHVVKNLVETNVTACQFSQDECAVKFIIKPSTVGDSVQIEVLKDLVCPEEVDILMIILSVVGGVVAIGIFILVLIRVLMYISDKREYAKFSSDIQNAKFAYEDNPIFKAPTTTYQNPSFQATVPPIDDKADLSVLKEEPVRLRTS